MSKIKVPNLLGQILYILYIPSPWVEKKQPNWVFERFWECEYLATESFPSPMPQSPSVQVIISH